MVGGALMICHGIADTRAMSPRIGRWGEGGEMGSASFIQCSHLQSSYRFIFQRAPLAASQYILNFYLSASQCFLSKYGSETVCLLELSTLSTLFGKIPPKLHYERAHIPSLPFRAQLMVWDCVYPPAEVKPTFPFSFPFLPYVFPFLPSFIYS